MNALTARIVRTVAADGGHGRHRQRGREHHPHVTDAQRQSMADLGFGFGPGVPRVDFHDPAVRAQFVAALRSCGILPPAPVEPTTTTTTTGPVIITSVHAR